MDISRSGFSNGMNRVVLVGVLIGIAALLAADFTIFKPNRLVPGEGAQYFAAPLPGVAVLPVLLWGVLLFAALRPSQSALRTGLIALGLMPGALLLAAGLKAAALLAPADDYSRVALGSGFWIQCFGLFFIGAELSRFISGRVGRAGIVLLAAAGLVVAGVFGELHSLSIFQEFAGRRDRFFIELKDHLFIAFVSAGISTCLGLPLGLLIQKKRLFTGQVFFLLNIVQTIPSLALFGLLIAPLALLAREVPLLAQAGVKGIGATPAIIALSLYALLPVVRNTFTGLEKVDPGVVEAGRGMGMGRLRLLLRVELPLALPVILGGVRIACVQNIGNTAVAALIGAGGFGAFIFQGLGQAAADLILLGAVPVILIAVVTDGVFQFAADAVAPKDHA